MTMAARIEGFLNQKRLAMVGVPRGAREFSRKLFDEFRDRGYDMVPVNPATDDLDGVRCYPRVQDIDPPVDGVLIITSDEVAGQVVRDCVEAGISRVWLYGINGPSSINTDLVRLCEENGIDVIPGYCPYMFFRDAGFFHRFHAWVMKLIKTYPA